MRKRAQKANKKKKPVAMPKRNGAPPPAIKKPADQINSIAEGNRQNAPSANATSSNEHTFSTSFPDNNRLSDNGPIVTKVQNHSNNPDKHLAVIQEKKVRQIISIFQ